jgi:hypothetical protein
MFAGNSSGLKRNVRGTSFEFAGGSSGIENGKYAAYAVCAAFNRALSMDSDPDASFFWLTD